MKCTTLQYIANLKGCCDSLKEIIAILGPIRVDAEEGAMGLKVILEVGRGIEPVLVLTNNNFLHLHHEEGKKGGESLHQMQFRVKLFYPALSCQTCLGFTSYSLKNNININYGYNPLGLICNEYYY